MDDWLSSGIQCGLARLETHGTHIGLGNVDEFTFRAFVMVAIKDRCPDAALQSEWHKYDLLAQADGENHLVEFKCYIQRRSMRLDGQPGGWKGGAGPKNEGEFRRNIRKLHECSISPIHARHIVLCYERRSARPSHYSFDQSYASMQPGEMIERVQWFEGESLRCAWMTVR